MVPSGSFNRVTILKAIRFLTLLFVAAYLLTGVYQIRPEERAVVKRFGRIVARPGPGLWIGLPWGMDRVERIPVAKVQRVTVGFRAAADDEDQPVPPGLLLSGDENLVTIRVNVDFALAEGDVALDAFVLHRDRSEGIIAREAEGALAEWASGRAIDNILLAGSGELPRWLAPRLQTRLDPYRLGVRIQHVSVALVAPPEKVQRDFERVNQAEAVNKTREHRALQEKEQRLRDAENAAYRMSQEARSYVDTRAALAHAEASEFRKRLEQYHRLRASNPNILAAIWWDEMARTFQGMKERGRIDLLDHYLGPDGLDISRLLPPGGKK
jgi:membrane protease subunit HflK